MPMIGWRATYAGIGLIIVATVLPLSLMMRRRPAAAVIARAEEATRAAQADVGISPRLLLVLLVLAGFSCCVAMSMPQVHIVAYCGDLGYGAQHGAEMLSLMLGFGVVSRVTSGWVADHIGGIAALLIGSIAQTVALTLYLGLTSLDGLYVASAFFGLVQGGLVPSYAIIIRECFPAKEAGRRVGVVIMMTLFGMALGGWMSGVIYDWTGSYRAAFANGVAFNVANAAIALYLLWRARRRSPLVTRVGQVPA
jgi:MFS family permease